MKIHKGNRYLLEELSINNKKELHEIIIKLSEETGEVSEAYLSMNKVDGSSYKDGNMDDLVEELVDVTMVSLSALYKLGVSEDVYNDILRSKLNKWKDVTNKFREEDL